MQICLFLVFKLCLHIAKAAEEMEFFIVNQQLVHLQGSRWTGNSKFILFFVPKLKTLFKTHNLNLEQYKHGKSRAEKTRVYVLV